MPTIIYVSHDGARREIQAKVGQTVMEAAVRNNIPGIVAECGGACSCGTCHVILDAASYALAGEASSDEMAILEFSQNATPTSRLSCQIVLADRHEGLVAVTPESQYG